MFLKKTNMTPAADTQIQFLRINDALDILNHFYCPYYSKILFKVIIVGIYCT